MKKRSIALTLATIMLSTFTFVSCGTKKEATDIVIIGAGGAGLAQQFKQSKLELKTLSF